MPSRRFHYKSRHGCLVCKTRKVKCDRQRPACGHCIKRGEICAYNNDDCDSIQFILYGSRNDIDFGFAAHYYDDKNLPLLSSWPYGYAPLPRHPFDTDLSLFERFTSQVSFTLTDRTHIQSLYSSVIVQMSFDHAYLAHSLLAISAIHMIQTENMTVDQVKYYQYLGLHHQNAALALVRPQLASITTENCESVYICATLIFIFTVASSQPFDPSMLLEKMVEFCELARGVRAVIEGGPQLLKTGRLKPFFDLQKWDHLIPPSSPSHVLPNNPLVGVLQSTIDSLPSETDHLKPVYRDALGSLNLTLAAMAVNRAHPAIIFMWLVLVDRKFTTLMAARDPIALRILECYGECTQAISDKWWGRQLGRDIVAGVRRVLQGPNHDMLYSQPQMVDVGWEGCVAD